MTSSRRQFLRWSAAAAAVPLLSACADDTGTTGAGPKHRTVKLIHASKDPLVLWSVTYLAEDMGFYQEEGLTVERVLLAGGPAALTGLLSGAGDANLSAPGELLAAATKGQRLKVLLAHTNSMPSIFVLSKKFAERVGVTAESPLEERRTAIGKVKGGRFGITAPGSQTDGFTRLALKQAGLDPGKDASIVPLQTAANSLAALANDQIDGFIGVPPSAEKAVFQFGAVPLLVNQEGDISGGDRLQGMTVQARAQDVDARPDLYKAFVRADIRATKALVDDPDKAAALLRKTRFGQFEEPIWNYAWKLLQSSWGSPYVTQDSLAAWFDNGLVAGATAAGFPFGDVVDMRFADEAVAALGWKPPTRT
ncbi:sulfonate ABC transporter substrate-binding protein [Acrocarpospora corrugata]|uniref:Sulfonate ABC transporter substrate-binding protein n=1 Tax=Acrocarpospora corrugata TaxID=35763 RepID=A0A5M3WA05_9ACTN|nr:ABC transporter substrate-binding protein [Acrocarpospora corrugata]GES05704.1 sulfonate ABC transporter substrate-binding protein [Acrocarpospora corrugata]